MKSRKALIRRGRPRGFDAELALERALNVFWRKGYEGASLPELTGAMRINRPSMYAAFGNKEALFRKAIDRYAAGPGAYLRQALEAPTARGVAEQLLYGGIRLLTRRGSPHGCLVVQGALACGAAGESVRNELTARREASVRAILKRFERARSEGDLPADSDPASLARYIATIMHGMAVQAASGASAVELRRVAQIALKNWP